MAVKITGVEPRELPVNPTEAHIAMQNFSWIDEQDQQKGRTNRDVMYDWIVNRKGKAYVLNDNNERVYVFGAIGPKGERYIRTAENGQWSNLLIDLEKQSKPPSAS